MLKLRFGGGWILTHFGTPFAGFLREMHPKCTSHQPLGFFHSNYFAMMFVYYKSTKKPKIM